MIFDSFLDKKASQVDFAELVGVTQPAINKHMGSLLQKGQSYRTWLHIYCEHLRSGAAGRSGDDQANLTRARASDAEAKAALNRLAYHEKIGTLVSADDAAKAIANWAGFAVREFDNAFMELAREIESQHGVKINKDKYSEMTSSALLRVGKYAEKVGESLTDHVSQETHF